MPLYRINKYEMIDDLVDSERSLSQKVITKMISFINIYCNGTKNFSQVKLFINECFMDDLFSHMNFMIPALNQYKKDGIVGKLAGTVIYVSDSLDEREVFVGESEKEIEILKRNEKINKILER